MCCFMFCWVMCWVLCWLKFGFLSFGNSVMCFIWSILKVCFWLWFWMISGLVWLSCIFYVLCSCRCCKMVWLGCVVSGGGVGWGWCLSWLLFVLGWNGVLFMFVLIIIVWIGLCWVLMRCWVLCVMKWWWCWNVKFCCLLFKYCIMVKKFCIVLFFYWVLGRYIVSCLYCCLVCGGDFVIFCFWNFESFCWFVFLFGGWCYCCVVVFVGVGGGVGYWFGGG